MLTVGWFLISDRWFSISDGLLLFPFSCLYTLLGCEVGWQGFVLVDLWRGSAVNRTKKLVDGRGLLCFEA